MWPNKKIRGSGWLMEHVHIAIGFVLVGGGYLGAGALSFGLRHHRPAIPDIAPGTPEPEPVVADLE